MDKLRFSRYFQKEHFPISVTVMPASGVTEGSPPHSHEFSEIILIAEGSIIHLADDERVKLNKGDFMLIHPGAVHSYTKPSKDAVLYNLLYDATIPIPMLMMSSLPFIQQVYPVDHARTPPYTGVVSHASRRSLPLIVNALERIRGEVRRRAQGHHILITSLFMEIALLLARDYTKEAKNDPDWVLNKVVGFLKCHYTGRIEVRDLAHVAGMSARTLLRKFKSTFGIGPAEYLIELRARHAAALLRNRDLKLATVASESGFCDSSHMWKALKKKLQQTPSEIRRCIK